jgi:hypothetical protein
VRSSVWHCTAAAGFALAAFLFWRLHIIDSATIEADLGNVDFFAQIYPMQDFAARSLQNGEIPLWNPHQLAGQPFLATFLYGALYPLNFLYLILPSEAGIEYTTVLHLFLAGILAYAYGRSIKLHPLAALAAGVMFAFSGQLIWLATWYTSAFCAAVWIPLGFLALERILETRRPQWVLVLVAATAMPLLAGNLQLWTYACYALALYWALRAGPLLRSGDGRRSVLGLSALVALGLLFGVGLSAAQILPTAELSFLSERSPQGLSVKEVLSYGALDPGELLRQSLVPEGPGLRRVYVGALAALLLPISLLSGRVWSRTLALWLIAILTLAIALSIHTPVFGLHRMLPLGTWFRDPTRVLFVHAFATAALVGLGLDVLARRAAVEFSWRRVAVLLLCVAVPLGIVISVDAQLTRRWALWLGVTCLLGAAMLRHERLRHALLAAFLVLLGWQLTRVSSNPYEHPYHGVSVLDREEEAFEYIRQRQGLFRTYIHSESPLDYSAISKMGTLHGLYSVTDYEPLNVKRFGDLFRMFGIPQGYDPELHPFTGALLADVRSPHFDLLDLLSVRYAVATERFPLFRGGTLGAQTDWRLAFRPRRGRFMVYERIDPLPRAYLVSRAEVHRDGASVLRALARDDFDPRLAVVLEGDVAAPALQHGQSRTPMTARISEYTARRVVVEVPDGKSRILVLTDTHYPGWVARIDGAREPILRANYLFRAVAVSAGPHTVVFSYEPLSFRVGAVVSLLTLVLCCAAALLFRRNSPSLAVGVPQQD